MESLQAYLDSDLAVHLGFRARRKRKARLISKQKKSRNTWMEHMVPFVFNYHLTFCMIHDVVTRTSYYRPKRVVQANWNIFLSTYPNHHSFGKPNPTHAMAYYRDVKRVSLSSIPIQVGFGPSFREHLLYQRSLFYVKQLPCEMIWQIFVQYLLADDVSVGRRSFVYDSNMWNARSGKRSLPERYSEFEFHLKYKRPSSVCIGPVLKRSVKTVPRECTDFRDFCENGDTQTRVVLEYVPRELVFRCDIRSKSRVCCGTRLRLCEHCKGLLSFYASVICSILHEVFLLDCMIVVYDGETAFYVICMDYKLFEYTRAQRKDMALLLRAVLGSCANKRLIPCTLRGVVQRVTDMMKSYLKSTWAQHVCGAYMGTSMFVDHRRVRDLLDLTGLSDSAIEMLQKHCTQNLTMDDFVDLVLEVLQETDKLNLRSGVCLLDCFVRTVFPIQTICLDELPLNDMIYPCPLSVNPYSNNICFIMTFEYPIGYSLDLQPLPVMVTPIDKQMRKLTGDENFFPSLMSRSAAYKHLRVQLQNVETFLSNQGRNIVFDMQMYHLDYHYTKYDRYLAFKRLALVLRQIIMSLQINPFRPTHFGSIFKQKNRHFMPCDGPNDMVLRDAVIGTLLSYFTDTDYPTPIRMSSRYMRAIVGSSDDCILTNTWLNAFEEDPEDQPTFMFRKITPDLTEGGACPLFRQRVVRSLTGRIPIPLRQALATPAELRALAEMPDDGFHPMEEQLHRRSIGSQGIRSQQAPLGMSSGDDYSDTSDTTSEYYSPDSDDYIRGPSIDHVQLTTNPAGRGPLVLTVVHTPSAQRNRGTVTQYIRLGTTETRTSAKYGVQTAFRQQRKHGAAQYRFRSNRIRTLRQRIRSPKRSRRADAHRQHWAEKVVEVPPLPDWPQQAFYKTDDGYDADIDCNPEPLTKRRRLVKAASLRSIDSCFLSNKADAGHFHQVKCALTPSVNLSDLEFEDTLTLPSEPETSPIIRSNTNKQQTYSLNFRPRFKNYERIANVTMSNHQYSVQLLKRIFAGPRSDDTESLWAGHSVHTDMSYPDISKQRDNVQRLLEHIRIEGATGAVCQVPKPVPSRYAELLEETGICGDIIDPSSASEGEALTNCCIAPETIKAQYKLPAARTEGSNRTYRSGEASPNPKRRRKRIPVERLDAVRTRLSFDGPEEPVDGRRVPDGLFEGMTFRDRALLQVSINMSVNQERDTRAVNPFYTPNRVFFPAERSEPGGFRTPAAHVESPEGSSSPSTLELAGVLSSPSPGRSPASDVSELVALFTNVVPAIEPLSPPPPRPMSTLPATPNMLVDAAVTPPFVGETPRRSPVSFAPRTVQVGGYVFEVQVSDTESDISGDLLSEDTSNSFGSDSEPEPPSFQSEGDESEPGHDLFEPPSTNAYQ